MGARLGGCVPNPLLRAFRAMVALIRPEPTPEPARPQKRRWGLGLTCSLFGLTCLGLGIADQFDHKRTPGLVLIAMGIALAGLGGFLFTRKFTPAIPLPKLGWKKFAAVILAGCLAGLAFPILFPVFGHQEQLASGVTEILAWVGLLPLCWVVDRLDPKRAFGMGTLAGMAFFNMTFWWVNVAMTTFGGIPNFLSIPVLQLLVGWCAIHWGLAAWGSSLLQRRFNWPIWRTLPPVWAATELMRNYFMSGYPWANLGYATSRDLWFAQVAGIGGIYLIAFVLVLVNAVLFDSWSALRRKDRPLPKLGIAIAALLVLGGHAYGFFRVRSVEAKLLTAPKVKVAAVQGNIDQKIKNSHQSYAGFILNQYLPQTIQADAEGADLIVWPEAAFPGYFQPHARSLLESRDLRPRIGDRTFGANLLVGVGTANEKTNKASNSAFWVRPDLSVAAQYDKHHLVPFGEYVLWNLDRYLPIGALVTDVGLFTPGTELPIWQVPTRDGRTVNVGMLICYDAIFPEITRDYAERNVDLLVNITNDAWYGWASAPYQFLRMVEMRAIESGRSVARAANTGISAFIDPAGRITSQTELGLVSSDADTVDEAMHVPATHLTAEVPILDVPPLYVRLGDSFAYACAIFAILGVAMALFVPRSAVER